MSALHALQPLAQPTQQRPHLHGIHGPAMTAEQVAQATLRGLVREFLRSVPADEPDAVLELVLLDGSLRQITRGALQQRIEHGLRPRMRRVVERQFIGHVSRDLVAKELCCSIKTLERDSQEALDLLISDASEPGA